MTALREAIMFLYPGKKNEQTGTPPPQPRAPGIHQNGGHRKPFRNKVTIAARVNAAAAAGEEMPTIPEEPTDNGDISPDPEEPPEEDDTATQALVAELEAQPEGFEIGMQEFSDRVGALNEVMATVTSQKLRVQTIGRGWTDKAPPKAGQPPQGAPGAPQGKARGKGPRLTRDQLMKIHLCTLCLQYGHWSDTCSKNPKNSASSSRETPKHVRVASLLSRVTENLNDMEAYQSPKQSMVVHVAYEIPRDPLQICGTKLQDAPMIGDHEPVMVLDTACQRSCASQAWLQAHIHLLTSAGIPNEKSEFSETFRFGEGKNRPSSCRHSFVAATGGRSWVARVCEVEQPIPFWVSLSAIEAIGAIPNMITKTVYLLGLGISAPLVRTRAGYIAICLHDEFLEDKCEWLPQRHWQRD